MNQVVETDAEGISVADGENDLCLRRQRNPQTPCNDVDPAVGSGKTIPFPGGKGLSAGTPDGCSPYDVAGVKTQLGDSLQNDFVIWTQTAAGAGRAGNFPRP